MRRGAGIAVSVLLWLAAAYAPPALAQESASVPAPAPAAIPDATPPAPKPAWMEYKDNYAGEQNDLANPHRTPEEIQDWVQEVATEALTFDPANMAEKMAAEKSYFVAQGWQQYTDYLNSIKLVELVSVKNYSVTTIFDGEAKVLNSASAGGTYHWLVEAPLMITFTRPDPETGMAKPAGGGKFKLVMQLGRVGDSRGKQGLAVESWKVMQR